MDKSSFLGLCIALGGIIAGLTIEGGNVGQIMQPTAAMIVFGGTLGAVLLQYPLPHVLHSFGELKSIFFYKQVGVADTIAQIIQFSQKARKQGIVALDKDLDSVNDPFLRKSLMMAVDGTQASELRDTMEEELEGEADRAGHSVQVFESAGGFAPTIGIIGAVLGLIQVMQHLADINEVGHGIATAFVATLYGVGSANLFFLPVGGKLRVRQRLEQQRRQLMLEGVICIVEGMNPRMLQTKLEGLAGTPAASPAGAAPAAAAAAAGGGGEGLEQVS